MKFLRMSEQGYLDYEINSNYCDFDLEYSK